MKKFWIILLICTQLTCIAGLSAQATITPHVKKERVDSLAINTPAPEFQLRDLKGRRFSLKNLEGRIVVLNFWFIACKPCVNEMPALNAIKKMYDTKNVVFLALSLDQRDAVLTFLKNKQFDYTILPDAKGTAEKYNLNAYPASIVIDTRGIIRFIQIGVPNIGQNLNGAINALRKNGK